MGFKNKTQAIALTGGQSHHGPSLVSGSAIR